MNCWLIQDLSLKVSSFLPVSTSDIVLAVPLYSLAALLGASVIAVIILGIKYVAYKKAINENLFVFINRNYTYRIITSKQAPCIDYTTMSLKSNCNSQTAFKIRLISWLELTGNWELLYKGEIEKKSNCDIYYSLQDEKIQNERPSTNKQSYSPWSNAV